MLRLTFRPSFKISPWIFLDALGQGFSGTGGGVSAVLATVGTGYLVTRFSYQPTFVLAGLMHPMSLALIYWLLPDRDFQKACRSQVLTA